MKTKEDIANLAESVGKVSNLILSQLSGKITPDFKESYLLGILSRSTILLRDITNILRNNETKHLTSVFILFRCLLDDFIHILYLKHNEFDEEEVIKITADAHRQRFNTIKASREINEKYFDGKYDQLQTSDKEALLKEMFLADRDKDKFFQDKEQFRFKKFPNMQSLIDDLPETEIGRANIHAFVIWKFLSQYIHFSNLTFYLENDPKTREVEITQLEEILFYCYKTVFLIYQELAKNYGFLELIDPDNVEHYFSELVNEK